MKEIIDPCFDYENGCLKNNLGITDSKKLRQAESDFAIVRIAEILKTNNYYVGADYLKELHKIIFGDIYPFAGTYRVTPIVKEEKILAYLSVDYEEPELIEQKLNEVFEKERQVNFNDLTTEEKIDHVVHLIVDIWKIHPFREGNTRTVLVFLREYLKYYGITFDPALFKSSNNFLYTRNALVAASFEAEDLDVKRNYDYIRVLISDIINDNINKKL